MLNIGNSAVSCNHLIDFFRDFQGPAHDFLFAGRFKRRFILDAVARNDGNWAAAARQLGIHRSNLHKLARRLGIK